MSICNTKILYSRRLLVAMVLNLVVFIWGGLIGTTEVTPNTRILHLTPDKDHYFLGPYLSYLEDPEKKLTIEEVSSSLISGRFIKHMGKKLNLGLNPYAYWIHFTIIANELKGSDRKWLLDFGWPNSIDYATLYIPQFDDSGWSFKEVGRILPTGPDPLPNSPTSFLPQESSVRPVTFYLRVVSSDAKLIPLEILTGESY